ncbi:PEP-CTERM protein-sorting domain-containing protein [Sphingomonas laterariae]|uniref:PEP-CTERM protein-sorting domain-containing protein n=2 Tax=Edaphosphingomonas laterariae TaxID=861865 RepID=A0A239BNX4_9SPHN|nr:PEP-CTERM protein-sorting domain-containing protein [Sphingomonas laterariae]
MMRKLMATLVLATGMWAGQAQAAFISVTFEAWGSGSEMYFDPFGTSLPTGKSGNAYASFGVTVDAEQLFSGGMESFWTGFSHNGISAGYSLDAPKSSASASAGALFADGSFGDAFPLLDRAVPLAGGLSISYGYAGGQYGNFNGTVTRVTTRLLDNATPSAGFSITVVPEPTSWAMMIAGFAFIGGSVRRARHTGHHVQRTALHA